MDLTFRGTSPALPEEESGDGAPSLTAAPPAAAPWAWTWWRVGAVVVLVLGVFVRFASWSHLWLDEALTLNIARLPLQDLPEALRQDGAPPLYYVVLHGWTTVFGTSTFAVRALAGFFGVTTLPLIWLVANRLGGRRVAWGATLLLASGPFAARYSTESRMYSLVMVLVLVGVLALLSIIDGSRRLLPAAGLAVVTGLLLLTHYWSFYLAAVAVAGLVWVARRGPETRRHAARRALVAMAVGGLLFVPWLPTFLYQLRHTGTPWGRPGGVRSVFDTVTHFAGGYWDAGIPLGLIYFGLIVLALFGWSVDRRRIVLDLRARQPGKWLFSVAFGTLVLAIVAGHLGDSAFTVRYAAVVYPLFIVLVALGTDVFADGRAFGGLIAVAVVLGFWANIPNVVGERTSAARVASVLDRNARPGDVVGYCPDQLGPSVTRELQASGLVHVPFPRGGPPQFIDWRDYADVNRAARPYDYAQQLLARAGPSQDVWLVWAPGYRTVSTKCQNIIDVLDDARPNNARVVKVSTKYFERPGLVRFRAT